jgi:hypothetical protein
MAWVGRVQGSSYLVLWRSDCIQVEWLQSKILGQMNKNHAKAAISKTVGAYVFV